MGPIVRGTEWAHNAPGDAAPQAPIPDWLRQVGDYELSEEIGHGGMGVVYRARQVSLNRWVALKMLLPAPFASDEFIRRFQAEAQAVANLHHPNIVALHEVGVHAGQHYFSMDYVAGRNLAELTRTGPLPADRAARYAEGIARAIHYAHQQGVLHRDLKPSNILVDARDQPQITDFGLAKRLSLECDLTVTGQILGSPHYLPPEQAQGRNQGIGPASDVYGIGAVLYHLLTGQPPFQGEGLPEVLHQVIAEEPPALRALNPGVPRDLETICLKCLRKTPGDRYAGAAELAEDLHRWQAGEPIRARPPTRAERLWYWGRRHPVSSALAAALFLALLAWSAVFARRQLSLWQLQRADELLYFWEGTHVFVGNPAGTAWRRLPIRGFAVDVSPNGRQLCYMRNEGTNSYLWTSRLDGTREQRVTSTQSLGRWIDDDTILYHAEELRSVCAIHVRTGARRKCFDWSRVTPNGFAGHLGLSPDRSRLLSNPQNGAYSPTQDLFVCDLAGGNVRTVWEDPTNDTEDSNALWLAGDRFVWRRGRQPGHDQRGMAIATCRLGDTNYQALTDWEGLKWPVAASPDGQRLLYLQELGPRGGAMELWLMNSDGSHPRRFLSRPLALPAEGDLGVCWYQRRKAGR